MTAGVKSHAELSVKLCMLYSSGNTATALYRNSTYYVTIGTFNLTKDVCMRVGFIELAHINEMYIHLITRTVDWCVCVCVSVS